MKALERWLGPVLAGVVLALTAPAEAADAGATLGDAVFLKPPEGFAACDVAKTPPTVYVQIFEGLPDAGKQTLWSSWGHGCIASDGKYYTTIGNHLDLYGGTGESRVYEFDPAAKALRRVLNVRDVIPDAKLAGGKIHARIQEAADGWLYFTTYWGKVPKTTDWDAGFQGSALLRYDPRSGKTECLGVPVPQQGLPTSCLDARRNLLYCYAVYSDDLVVYDVVRREVKYRGSGDLQAGSRNIMIDLEGNAYFSTADGRLGRYSPATNQVTVTKAALPKSARETGAGDEPAEGGPKGEPGAKGAKASAGRPVKESKETGQVLRASTRPARDGTIYGMTRAGMLFAFDPKTETVKDLGPNFLNGDYTAVVLLSPDEKYLYYAPGSHGSAQRHGAALVQYEIAAGKRKVLAFLAPPLREKLQYVLGGSFNLTITADGGTLLGTFNGAAADPAARRVTPFGRPCLLMIEIPKSER